MHKREQVLEFETEVLVELSAEEWAFSAWHGKCSLLVGFKLRLGLKIKSYWFRDFVV